MINKKELDEIITINDKYCVSIYIPTYRTGHNQEDNLRFKNALSDATNQLQDMGLTKKEALKYLAKGFGLLDNDRFWLHQSDGLAVFISSEHFEYYTLPLHFKERISIGRNYYIRPIISLISGDNRFFLLALSQNEVQFFEGNKYSITSVIIEDLVPSNLEEAVRLDEPSTNVQMHGPTGGNGKAIFHGQGAGKDSNIKLLSDYFTKVDAGLMEMLHDEHSPMIVATVDSNFPLYKNVSKYLNLLDIHVSGNPENMDPVELHERAWNAMTPYRKDSREKQQSSFNEKLVHGKASTNITETISAAVQGKVSEVYINKEENIYGNYDAHNHTISLHDRQKPDSEELLEFIARKVYEQSGKVYNTDNESLLKSDATVNAVLRF